MATKKELAALILATVSESLERDAQLVGEPRILGSEPAHALATNAVNIVLKFGGSATEVLEAIHTGASAAKTPKTPQIRT